MDTVSQVRQLDQLWLRWTENGGISKEDDRYAIAFEWLGWHWIGAFVLRDQVNLTAVVVVIAPASGSGDPFLLLAVQSHASLDIDAYDDEGFSNLEFDEKLWSAEEFGLPLIDTWEDIRGGTSFGQAATIGLEHFQLASCIDKPNEQRLLLLVLSQQVHVAAEIDSIAKALLC